MSGFDTLVDTFKEFAQEGYDLWKDYHYLGSAAHQNFPIRPSLNGPVTSLDAVLHDPTEMSRLAGKEIYPLTRQDVEDIKAYREGSEDENKIEQVVEKLILARKNSDEALEGQLGIRLEQIAKRANEFHSFKKKLGPDSWYVESFRHLQPEIVAHLETHHKDPKVLMTALKKIEQYANDGRAACWYRSDEGAIITHSTTKTALEIEADFMGIASKNMPDVPDDVKINDELARALVFGHELEHAAENQQDVTEWASKSLDEEQYSENKERNPEENIVKQHGEIDADHGTLNLFKNFLPPGYEDRYQAMRNIGALNRLVRKAHNEDLDHHTSFGLEKLETIRGMREFDEEGLLENREVMVGLAKKIRKAMSETSNRPERNPTIGEMGDLVRKMALHKTYLTPAEQEVASSFVEAVKTVGFEFTPYKQQQNAELSQDNTVDIIAPGAKS